MQTSLNFVVSFGIFHRGSCLVLGLELEAGLWCTPPHRTTSPRPTSSSPLSFPGTLSMAAAGGPECHKAHVVGANGEMDGAAMEGSRAATGLASRGLSYAVVSVFEPQGSGKISTASSGQASVRWMP